MVKLSRSNCFFLVFLCYAEKSLTISETGPVGRFAGDAFVCVLSTTVCVTGGKTSILHGRLKGFFSPVFPRGTEINVRRGLGVLAGEVTGGCLRKELEVWGK